MVKLRYRKLCKFPEDSQLERETEIQIQEACL